MVARRRLLLWIAAYALLDVIAVGMGMGVPMMPILLGFLVGWFLPRFVSGSPASMRRLLSRILGWAGASAGWTFLQMAVIWLPTVRMLFGPSVDIAEFGEPMILYEPVASYVGWIVLMVFISPFLQLLTTVFGATLRLALGMPGIAVASGEGAPDSAPDAAQGLPTC